MPAAIAAGQTLSVALTGVRGQVMEVEAAMYPGLPGVQIIGLPDASVAEARERVHAAVVASGLAWPSARLVVNLRPAELRKMGSGFDLAVAVAVLRAVGVLPRPEAARRVHLGEFGLDGRVHPVRGVLPAVAAAVAAGCPQVVVPAANAEEARLVPGAEVTAIDHFSQLAHAYGADQIALVPPWYAREIESGATGGSGQHERDLADVIGQDQARHALEVAAAGAHHLFLSGPPGSGKTMLAARLSGLLPDLDDDAAVQVTAVHSVAGTYQLGSGLIRRPPYEAPHHTATPAAIIGGGSGLPRPGAAIRAHRGVLFLDEAPEFARQVLETLRQPLEEGRVSLQRSRYSMDFPCRFQLVLASNPCPCGRGGGKGIGCRCSAQALQRYQSRLSGPLLDRVDIQVEVAAVSRARLIGGPTGETTATVAARVAAARRAQADRWRGTGWLTNADVDGSWLQRYTRQVDRHVLGPLEHGLEAGSLSMRGVDRVLRVAWTLADLQGLDHPSSAEIGEALTLRNQGHHG